MLTCIKIVFLETYICTVNAHSGKRMLYKTPVLHTLFDVRKTGVNEHTFNMRYSIYMFTTRLRNACFTHVAHFPV